MAAILCIDDETDVRRLLERTLDALGHRALTAASVDEGLALLGRQPVDLILSDFQMPGATGHDLLRRLKETGRDIPVIIMTGFSSIEHAVSSIRRGAIDYLPKPISLDALEVAVERALEVDRLRRENEEFRRELGLLRGAREIVGDSAALRRVLEAITMAAPTRAPVLLEGETGTGKELVARALHAQSPRAAAPFVTVNCAALPEGLVESVLFGHERGAFTGATTRAVGAFERAHGGTLLLDEISEMRLDLQPKLLRAVQEQEFERVGGVSAIRVDVRIVATTNRDLRRAVETGAFREDLYYRLAVVPVRLPPLRERPGDVALLVPHFLRRGAEALDLPVPQVEPEALRLLQVHPWPGNVRELSNLIERAMIGAPGRPLSRDAVARLLADAPRAGGAPAEGPTSGGRIPAATFDLRTIEREVIRQALEVTDGNRKRAAALLGVTDRTLRNKLNVPGVRK